MIKIYLVGISCVGKSTIGELLARKIGFNFYDFDNEIEKYLGRPIEYIIEDYLFPYSYREDTSGILENLLNNKGNSVIAASPSGLRDVYLRIYKKSKKNSEDTLISINIKDKAENILKRITFYDKESVRMDIKLSDREKVLYLKKIKKEITFYKKYNSRADYEFNIENMVLDSITTKLVELLISRNEDFKEYLSNYNAII